jgi:hypothetical protein
MFDGFAFFLSFLRVVLKEVAYGILEELACGALEDVVAGDLEESARSGALKELASVDTGKSAGIVGFCPIRLDLCT